GSRLSIFLLALSPCASTVQPRSATAASFHHPLPVRWPVPPASQLPIPQQMFSSAPPLDTSSSVPVLCVRICFGARALTEVGSAALRANFDCELPTRVEAQTLPDTVGLQR